MAADITSTLASWSTTAASNLPTGATAISANLDDNLREIQAVVRQLASSNTIASATTTNLSTINETFITVSGTTTITGLGTVSAGIYKWLTFSGILTFTHNATSLILPGAANITTAANDTCVAKSLGSGNWQVLFYARGSGAVVGADFSSNTATSVDGEIVLFSGTGGKTGKRATTTGLLKGASGVLSAAVAGTDYADNAFKTIVVSGQSDVVADTAADTLTLAAGSGITLTTNASTDTVTITNSANIFSTIAVSGQSDVVADSSTDTLTLVGSNITITTNASTDTITFTGAAASSSFTNIAVSGQSDVVADSATDTLTLVGSGLDITTNAGTDTVTFTSRTTFAYTTAQFDKTDATLADVTGLSQTVVSSGVYRFQADLHTAGGAGGCQAAIGGTATATAFIQSGVAYAASSMVASNTATMGVAAPASASNGIKRISVSGTITVNAGGTLTVQFAQNSASGTSSVLIGSAFILERMA